MFPVSQLSLSLCWKPKFPCMKPKSFFNLPHLKIFLNFYPLSYFLLPQANYYFLETDSYAFSLDSISHLPPNSSSMNQQFLSIAFFLLATSLPMFPLTEKKFFSNSHTPQATILCFSFFTLIPKKSSFQ